MLISDFSEANQSFLFQYSMLIMRVTYNVSFSLWLEMLSDTYGCHNIQPTRQSLSEETVYCVDIRHENMVNHAEML